MDNKIGVVTSTYHAFSTEETLDGISKGGFKYVELINVHGFAEHIKPAPEQMDQKSADKMLALCRSYGVELYCYAGHMRLMKDDSIKSFKKVIDAAELLGLKYITTDTGDVKSSEDEKKFYSDMGELGTYAKSKNITVCLEIHGEWCCTGKKAAEIVKKINNDHVRINYDTGNAIYYGGERPEEDIKYALPYMAFMHIKDSGGKKGVWDFPVLGQGSVDFERIFDLIKGYKGPISLELEFEGKPHPLEYVNDGVKKCNEFLRAHGYGN
jgi:L-ribulose-5-phosphate 3-epimerase